MNLDSPQENKRYYLSNTLLWTISRKKTEKCCNILNTQVYIFLYKDICSNLKQQGLEANFFFYVSDALIVLHGMEKNPNKPIRSQNWLNQYLLSIYYGPECTRDSECTVVNKRHMIPAILIWWKRLILIQIVLINAWVIMISDLKEKYKMLWDYIVGLFFFSFTIDCRVREGLLSDILAEFER